MRFGSVCSGIEAASVAWHPLGWQAAWLSEIEPFPCAVLKHHYPAVPNLGDMTKLSQRILSGEIEAPDLLCGGTPCQAFSVAGLRNSLDDHRGNLTLTFVEIANAIDQRRSVRQSDPAIIFWENVPGVLNTKDNAFGCFLAGLAGEDNALVPPGGRWTNAGFVDGPQRAVAWRVLDAQYFGVAQRRRRVFVVASARADFDPAAVLFEFDGLRRDTAPSRKTGQEVAGTISSRTTGGGGFGTDFECSGGLTAWPADVAPAAFGGNNTSGEIDIATARLACSTATGRLSFESETFLVQPAQALGGRFSCGIPGNWIGRKPENGGNAVEPMIDVSPCLTGTDKHGVAAPIAFHANAQADQLPSATRNTSISDSLTRSQNAAVVYPIDTQNMTEGHSSGGKWFGEHGDPSFALTKGHSHAAAYGVSESPDTAHCLRSGASKADKHESTTYVAQSAIGWSEDLTASVDLAGTIQRGGDGGRHDGVMTPAMAVRRLTPTECERLQGFPDGYTNIPWRTYQEAQRKGISYETLLAQRGMPLRGPSIEECPDGPRYKALGNSWAVPVVRWIGERISRAI